MNLAFFELRLKQTSVKSFKKRIHLNGADIMSHLGPIFSTETNIHNL